MGSNHQGGRDQGGVIGRVIFPNVRSVAVEASPPAGVPSPLVTRPAISAFARVHSPSKTGVNALKDALWRGEGGAPRGEGAYRVCCPLSNIRFQRRRGANSDRTTRKSSSSFLSRDSY
jgi:hypothetical protein